MNMNIRKARRNRLRRAAALAAAAVLAAAFFACNDPIGMLEGSTVDSGRAVVLPGAPPRAGGSLQLYLKDFPLEGQTVSSVWITVLAVEVHGESAGWWTVFESPAGTPYDLLTLVEQPVLIGTADLPADTYTQVRLLLGEDNRIVVEGEGEFPLRVPSGQQTGIKIVGEFQIREGTITSVVLDFDARQSVKLTGRQRYQLRPTVRIESVEYRVTDDAPPNAPPAVSFPGDYEVLSAGSPGVIGRYEITGTNEGRPLYRQVVPLGTEPYYLYYLTAADFGGLAVWALHAAVGTTLSGAQYYNGDGAAPAAPEGSWEAVQAAGSAEGRRLPISGSLNVGGTLRVHYLYTDPDGDSQDVGATGIRWLRYDSAAATDGQEIPGAGGESYTTTAADDGRWLRVELTPVDARGGVGEPALSPVVAVSAGG